MAYKAYKFPLKRLKKDQEQALHEIRRRCCELYNACLEERREAYRRQGVSITCRGNRAKGEAGQQAALVEIKKVRPEYKAIHSAVLQNVTARVDLAFKSFFRRVKARAGKGGYPRFKPSDRYASFMFPSVSQATPMRGGGVSYLEEPVDPAKPKGEKRIVEPRKLVVHGIPGALQVHWYRPMEGTPKTVSFVWDGKKWFVVFACSDVPEAKKLEPNGRAVGIDLGLSSFLALDDGTTIDAPRYFRKHERALAMAQRSLARKKRGSRRRRKQKALVASIHERIANVRREFHHKVASDLVQRYEVIVMEDLNIKGMVRTGLRGMSKSILDAGWGSFATILENKATGRGRIFLKENPAETTQDCSGPEGPPLGPERCGNRVQKDLSARVHECPKCGLKMDRDVNAARNILRKGIEHLARAPVSVPTLPETDDADITDADITDQAAE